MVHVRELLQHDLPHSELPDMSVGLAELDRTLGGLRPGRILLVATAPGQGKTSYAVQIAAAAALTDRRVRVHCPRETKRAVAARVLASTARVSYSQVLEGRHLDGPSRARAHAVRERLIATDFQVHADNPVDLAGIDDCDLLVVDDAHQGPQNLAGPLRDAARSGAAVLATIPLDLLVRGPVGVGVELIRTWADMCDHAIIFSWPAPTDIDREGEADLFLVKNRHGPLIEEVVAFQGAYARYNDLRA